MSSEIKANKISPATGTALTLADSGDTLTLPSGATLDIASGATLDTTGATVSGLTTGKVLQVVQTAKTDTTSMSGSAGWQDITGMSASITPATTSSKILITWHLAVSPYSVDTGTGQAMMVRPMRGSTAIFIGNSGGSSQYQGSIAQRPVDNQKYEYILFAGSYLDSPSTTSSTTYKMQWGKPFQIGGSDHITYLNRPYDEAAPSDRVRGASNIILMEIGA